MTVLSTHVIIFSLNYNLWVVNLQSLSLHFHKLIEVEKKMLKICTKMSIG